MNPIRRRGDGSSRSALASVLFVAGLALTVVAPALAEDDAVAPPPVAWLNHREAKAVARRSDRPLLIYFTRARSMPAARLDRETWTDPRLRRYLNEHLVVAVVDVQEMPAVAEHFDVVEVPTILFLTPDGKRAGHAARLQRSGVRPARGDVRGHARVRVRRIRYLEVPPSGPLRKHAAISTARSSAAASWAVPSSRSWRAAG